MSTDSSPPSRSSATTTTIAAQAYHVLKIDGYSSTLRCGRHRRTLRSLPFSAGGHTWHLDYFPNGCHSRSREFISLFLTLDDIVTEAVMAQATLSLLDRHGKPVPSHTQSIDVYNFSEPPRSLGIETFIRRDDLERSEHLNDDCFTVAVHVVVVTEETKSVIVPPSDMHLHYGDLLLSKEGADVEFLVRGEIFAAHRLVLAARSPVFKAELFRPTERATTNVIQIDNMEAEVFRALLTFIYTDTLPPEMGDEEDKVALVQQLLVAADMYGLQRLKLVCEDKLCNHIHTGSVATMLILAKNHHCRNLEDACFDFLGSSELSLVMKADDFQDLTQSFPTILEDLNSNIVARESEKTTFPSEKQESQINRIDIKIIPWQNRNAKKG